MSTRRVGVLCALAALVLTGCRVDTRVEVTMHDDGSGVVRSTVVLDAEALREIGGLSAARRGVPLTDLKRAGWTVSDRTPTSTGGAQVSFTHVFTGPADLELRIADLVGTKGVLRDPKVTRDHGWFSSRDELSLVVDMGAPTTGIGSDADLKARLRAYGVDPAAIDAELTQRLRSALHLTVVVHLPGGTTRELVATNGTVAIFRASQDQTNYDQMVKVGIALLLGLLAGLFLLAASASARRERRRRAQRVRMNTGEHERAPLM